MVSEDQGHFETAYAKLLSADTGGALAELEEFERRFPFSPLMDRALFWKAEALKQQGRHPEAIRAYQEGLARFPNGPYADDGLFRLASLLPPAQRSEKLSELVRRFPQSPWAPLAQEQLSSP
jgi:TolA-binding protein